MLLALSYKEVPTTLRGDVSSRALHSYKLQTLQPGTDESSSGISTWKQQLKMWLSYRRTRSSTTQMWLSCGRARPSTRCTTFVTWNEAITPDASILSTCRIEHQMRDLRQTDTSTQGGTNSKGGNPFDAQDRVPDTPEDQYVSCVQSIDIYM